MSRLKINKKLIIFIFILIFALSAILVFKEKGKNDEFLLESIQNSAGEFSGNLEENNNVQNSNNGIDSSINGKNFENKSNEQNYIYVHVIGEVNNPGLVKLSESNSRIINAVEASGGVTEKADLSKVNLAYVLSDGCKIRIPSVDDKEENSDNMNNEGNVGNGAGNNVIISGNNKLGSSKVNINSATQAELETLSGIGPSIAAKIIEYRNKNGKFSKIEDLKNVSGIGEEKYNSVKDSIDVK